MSSGESMSLSLQPFVLLETEVSSNEAFFVAISSILSSSSTCTAAGNDSSTPTKGSYLSLMQDGTYLVGLIMKPADPDVSMQHFQSQFSTIGSFTVELRGQPSGSEDEIESIRDNNVFEYTSTPTRVTSSSFLKELAELDIDSVLRNHKAVYFHHDKGVFIMSWVRYKLDDSLLHTRMSIVMNVCTYKFSSKPSTSSSSSSSAAAATIVTALQDPSPINQEQIVLNIMESSRYRVTDNGTNYKAIMTVLFECPLRLNTHSHIATDSSYLSIVASNTTSTRLLYIHAVDFSLMETRKHENIAFVDASDMFVLTCMNPPAPESYIAINTKESYTFVFRITAKAPWSLKGNVVQNDFKNMELFEGLNISTLHITYSTGNDDTLHHGVNRTRTKETVVSKAVTWHGVISDQRFSILGKSKDLGNAKKYEPICTEYLIKNLSSINRRVKLISLNHDNEITPDLLFFENESEQVLISAGEVVTLSVYVLPLREGVVNKNTVLLEEEELIDVDMSTGEKEKKRTIFQISDHFVPIEIGAAD